MMMPPQSAAWIFSGRVRGNKSGGHSVQGIAGQAMAAKAILMLLCVGVATISYLSAAVVFLLARDTFIRDKDV